MLSAEQKATDYRSPDDGMAPDHRPTNACTRWMLLEELKPSIYVDDVDIFSNLYLCMNVKSIIFTLLNIGNCMIPFLMHISIQNSVSKTELVFEPTKRKGPRIGDPTIYFVDSTHKCMTICEKQSKTENVKYG